MNKLTIYKTLVKTYGLFSPPESFCSPPIPPLDGQSKAPAGIKLVDSKIFKPFNPTDKHTEITSCEETGHRLGLGDYLYLVKVLKDGLEDGTLHSTR